MMGRMSNTSFDSHDIDGITGEAIYSDPVAQGMCSTWGAVAGAAVGVIGGAMSASSARSAGREQAQAGREASAAQLQAAREAQALQAASTKGGLQIQAPNIRGGNLALSALMSGMGLGAARGVYGTPAPSGNVGAPGSAGTAGSFMNAAGQAVDAQGNPLSSSDPYGMMGTNYGATDAEMQAAASPYANTFTEQFSGNDLTMDPSYKWRLEQGNRALAARQAAGGNRFGGQAMKDISDYNQGAASQEYGAAYDRFRTNKSDLYKRLADIAGLGSSAGNSGASSLANTGTNMASTGMTGAANSSNYLTSAAAANAAGRMGSTNALVGGINAGANNWYTMSQLNGSGGGGSSMPMINGGGYSNFPAYLQDPNP